MAGKLADLKDEELALRSLQDGEAFGILADRYEAKLTRYVRRLGRISQEDAQDILQEAFLRMYKGLSGYDPKLPFSSWAYRVAHNQAVSWMRKHRKHGHETVPLETDDEDGANLLAVLASDADVDAEIRENEMAVLVREAVQELPVKYRDVLVLRFLEDRSYAEIGDILKKPEGSVATLIHRAKKKLVDIAKQKGLASFIS